MLAGTGKGRVMVAILNISGSLSRNTKTLASAEDGWTSQRHQLDEDGVGMKKAARARSGERSGILARDTFENLNGHTPKHRQSYDTGQSIGCALCP